MKHGLFAAFAVALATTAAQANVEYVCDGFGDLDVRVTYFDEEDVATVTLFCPDCDNTPWLLSPIPSASGTIYEGDGMRFSEQGGSAFLNVDGVDGTCFVASVTEPGGPQSSGTLAGISWGGNLRAGPGTEFADVGGLTEGAPITIIRDSGVYFNGYSWWFVQTATGQRAYQWGGIMCVPGQVVPGIYGNC